MGCNCKGGKAVQYTYENSKDHVEMVRTTLYELFNTKPVEDMDDGDKVVLIQLFQSIFPRAKYIPEPRAIYNDLNQMIINYDTKKK